MLASFQNYSTHQLNRAATANELCNPTPLQSRADECRISSQGAHTHSPFQCNEPCKWLSSHNQLPQKAASLASTHPQNHPLTQEEASLFNLQRETSVCTGEYCSPLSPTARDPNPSRKRLVLSAETYRKWLSPPTYNMPTHPLMEKFGLPFYP